MTDLMSKMVKMVTKHLKKLDEFNLKQVNRIVGPVEKS